VFVDIYIAYCCSLYTCDKVMYVSMLCVCYYSAVAQLNADDLTTTEIDKLNLCALEFKISAGYFGRLVFGIV